MKTMAGLTLCTLCVVGYQDAPRFSSDVQLVVVDVQVTEKGTGRILDLLGPKDFELYDNDLRQDIRLFQFETAPLDLVFLLYGKSGVGPVKDINAFRESLTSAVDALRPGDRTAILRTDSASRIDLPLTDDLVKARRAIVMGGDCHCKTGHDHLYDAVMAAATVFPRRKDSGRRRAIFAITDDVERGSKITLNTLITEVLEADTTVNEAVVVLGFTGRRIGLGGVWRIPGVQREIGGSRSGESLRAVVEATGGEVVSGDKFRENSSEIIGRMRMRYLLGFYPAPTPVREFHTINVRLTTEAKLRFPSALIRARRGYYSAPATSSLR